MKYGLSLLLVFCVLLYSGCTSSGAYLSTSKTEVVLSEGNFTMPAVSVTGQSEAEYILGLSYSSGFMATTFALARIEGTGMLYAEALDNLWENFERDYGMSINHKLALANIRYDTEILNLLLYTKVKVMVRADVIEFY